jgi:DNA polymerase-1
MDHALNYYLVAPYEVEFVPNSSMEDCLEYIAKLDTVAVDIETTRKFKGRYGRREGLDPYLSSIVMIQVGDEDLQFIIDARVVDCLELIKLLATKEVVGHNIKFEYKHFLVNYGIRLNKVYDTMITEQILYNGLNKRNSLAALNQRYLNIYVDKTTRLEFLSIGNKKFTKRQIEYGAEDILYPLLIKEKQIPKLHAEELINCFQLEMKFLMSLGDIETKGLKFNTAVWEKAYDVAIVKFHKIKESLDNYVIENHPKFTDNQLSLFDEGLSCRIQWSSPSQVVEFFDHLGICPVAESKSTKQMTKTVEAKELRTVLTQEDLSDEYRWLINTYLTLSELQQATTTFGLGFYKYINPITKRLHSSYSQIKNTGRISSREPNLQNIPSDKEYRMAFDAPEGHVIVNADYSGQESIILVNKSLDEDLIEFYKSGGGDMHSYVASKIFPELAGLSLADIKKYHKDKRQIAKAANFALAYGGTGFTIAKNLGIPASQGEAVYNAYFKAFPGLKNYFDRCKRQAVKDGFILIDKQTRRKYYYPHLADMKHYRRTGDIKAYNKLKGRLERASLNYPKIWDIKIA